MAYYGLNKVVDEVSDVINASKLRSLVVKQVMPTVLKRAVAANIQSTFI
jgi:hypothetical protein